MGPGCDNRYVSADVPSFQRRDRAESFGLVAQEYDRYRPSYPAELIDVLAALGPRAVLDVGCGTGKAASMLLERGLSVLGVEIDPQMAAVAHGHGIEVEVGDFESWDDRGRRFDLITAAQAWHWFDPRAGAHKAAHLMHPEATLALFWNHAEPDAAARKVLNEVYGRREPALVEAEHHNERPDGEPHRASLQATGVFRNITTRDYAWKSTLPVDDFVSRLGTQSALVTLGSSRLAALLDELRIELRSLGVVTLTGGTYTIFARDPDVNRT
jgi:SAM-dependent methyltransferase